MLAVLEQARESVKARGQWLPGAVAHRAVRLRDAVPAVWPAGALPGGRPGHRDPPVRGAAGPALQGLRDELYDAGFSMADEVGDGLIVEPAWEDELMMALPAPPRAGPQAHSAGRGAALPPGAGRPGGLRGLRPPGRPGAAHAGAGAAAGAARGLARDDDGAGSAGLALGFAGAAPIAANREANVVGRPLAGEPPMLTAYLLRRDKEPLAGAGALHRARLQSGAAPGSAADDEK